MFCTKLRALRKEKGLTQRELGALVGLSASGIGMIEQGRRLPSRRKYVLLREVLAKDGRFPVLPVKASPRYDWLCLLREPGKEAPTGPPEG